MARQRQLKTTDKVWTPPAHEMSRLNYLGKGQMIAARQLQQHLTKVDVIMNNIQSLMHRALPQNQIAKEIRAALRHKRD